MFFKFRRASRASDTTHPVLTQIARESNALRLPSPSLYYTYLVSRTRERDRQLSQVSAALESTRAEGFAAAIRLMSLDAPERVLFNAYTEILSREGKK
jgi:hypothetical protein